MTTIPKLMQEQVLDDYDVGLDAGEVSSRRMLFMNTSKEWLEKNIAIIETDVPEGKLTPLEQFEDIVYRFTIGERFPLEKESQILKELIPLGGDVWEFKTPDLRLFGWFYKPYEFICTEIAQKEWIVQMQGRGIYVIRHRFYPNVIAARDGIDLEHPKTATPQEIHNELFT